MEVVFLGINDVGMRIYEWLCDRDGVTVSALVTTKDQLELVERLHPDIVVSVGYDHLVPSEILSIPSAGCLNLHPSFLPYNRGKSPNVWSIVDGTPAGVTLHYMDYEFDTGDIIAQQRVETAFSDTGKDLHERTQVDLFTRTWPDIEQGTVSTRPQERDAGDYHSIDDFRDLCDLEADEPYHAKEFLDVLRALTFPPFDNAYLDIDGRRYYVDVDIRPAEETTDDDTEGLLTSY